jgi:hypothetical protein
VAAVDRSGRLTVWEPDCPTDQMVSAATTRDQVRPQLVLERGDPDWLAQRAWCLVWEDDMRLWCGLENGCVMLLDFAAEMEGAEPEARPARGKRAPAAGISSGKGRRAKREAAAA